MASATDIPSWCLVECGFLEEGELGEDGIWYNHFEKHYFNLNEENLSAMFKMSPIFYVDNVKTPTMVVIGKQDKRVPIFNGFQFHYKLKSNNVLTKLYVYDDECHSISSLKSRIDVWINGALFFKSITS
eukprot:TRINITY_DN3494_c0_g3_i2.p1 TRINITY_DN3494_c0_g3~~TRINITY_DN3494_c0_g3_i2.p1  ORF type:complete len:129 (-),score=24.63 TRINITY_DN3494_c0_g3_i2:122-508(-)